MLLLAAEGVHELGQRYPTREPVQVHLRHQLVRPQAPVPRKGQPRVRLEAGDLLWRLLHRLQSLYWQGLGLPSFLLPRPQQRERRRRRLQRQGDASDPQIVGRLEEGVLLHRGHFRGHVPRRHRCEAQGRLAGFDLPLGFHRLRAPAAEELSTPHRPVSRMQRGRWPFRLPAGEKRRAQLASFLKLPWPRCVRSLGLRSRFFPAAVGAGTDVQLVWPLALNELYNSASSDEEVQWLWIAIVRESSKDWLNCL
mmetsp:Transcript_1960/g.5611  ORF Transcript_1960/g.5611 Transcript_1960/m.5611 type:complete len:252 (+) Transcript_1960:525-1280(+)